MLLLFIGGCPGDPQNQPDAHVPDQGIILSEAGLAFCRRPEAYCTPADPCGLNPRCGSDHLCRTDGTRDCNDGVPCTEDSCVFGGCNHQVGEGFCLIDAQCFAEGETKGCGRCEPVVHPTAWTPLDGFVCDDKNPCTLDDRCRQGVCVGEAYNCSDGMFCTTDRCDGKGGCLYHLEPDYCEIEKTCYRHGETDPTECLICDVDISQHAWQERKKVCTIKGRCYGAGSLDPTSCYTCEPLLSPDQWTSIPNLCLVGQSCVQKDSLHSSKCASCDPSQNKTGWTPLPGAFIWTVGFSSSLEGFTATPLDNGVGWQVSSARYTSPPGSLYYGHLLTKNYDNGKPNSGMATSPALIFLPQGKSYLSFQLFLDTEMANNFDVLSVRVNGQDLWVKSSSTLSPSDYRRWISVLVDLSALAGQTVKIVFDFSTHDDTNNRLEGIYIDDVTVLTGCPDTAQ